MRYERITDLIGNTPLVRIDPAIHGLDYVDLYAKLEMYNPFGSLKDRAAWSMLSAHLENAGPGASVIELSSGNTAKALAVLASVHGFGFKSITNRMKVPEIKEQLLLLGAEIEELPGQTECLDPTNDDDPLTQIYRSLAGSRDDLIHTDQYFNPRNTAAHVAGTGPEIIADLDGRGPDVFVACVGTAGSSTGVARVLRAHNPEVEVVGLVAAKSDFIPGIRNADEVHEVGLFEPATYDRVENVTADEAIDGMLTLVRRCGILSGPTGGGAYTGAVRHLRRRAHENRRFTAVFIVCDRVESYMSYVRQRRPALIGAPPRPYDVSSVTSEELVGVLEVDVREAQRWVASGLPLVVDLRGPFAWAAAHIEGSINIVDELFEELLRGGSPFPKSKPVLLACPVGDKSARYAALLARMGHPDVRSLAGGVVAWRDAGAPLVVT